jgi:hypothetical protein
MNLLQRNAWLLPVAFALLLGAVGWTSYRELEASMKAEIASHLETVRNSSVTALEIWADENKAVVNVFAADPEVLRLGKELLRVARTSENPAQALIESPAQAELRARMAPVVDGHHYLGWGITDGAGRFVGSARDQNLGQLVPGISEETAAMLRGETVVTPPREVPLGEGGAPIGLMLIGGPLRDEGGAVIGVFGFSIASNQEFAKILMVGRVGESGETYAFNEDGVLVSPSRFDDQLRSIGILPADEAVHSALNVEIRDPGGDMSLGFAPDSPVRARPFTKAAANAIAGNPGVDVEGFADYRGVPVAGAWSWVPEVGVGVTSEIDIEEAYAGLYVLRRRFAIVVGALVIGGILMFLYSFVVMRLRRQVDEARQVGRYRIERKLGSGGMGTVYLASHALLRRPTAIKILSAEKAGKEGLTRFEREVQVSSALSHPNTIDIYDFGRTPEGTFYYAMEYVKGITLGSCVTGDGRLSEARLLYVMNQACASIAEAHDHGLMHRDLKPSNIMLCERGGSYDFVKVLDFGLVKELEKGKSVDLTDVAALTGTPLYMPPEAVQAPETLDVRGDVYQLGLVAYFLLVGRNVFEGDAPMDVIVQHVSAAPTPPSEVLGRPLNPRLEEIIMRCLEKEPDKRFDHARALLEAFESCEVEGRWGQREARVWWSEWQEKHPEVEDDAPPTSTLPSGYDIDLGQRLPKA